MTSARNPLRAKASAAVSPPIPAPATMMVREDGKAIGDRSDQFAFQGAFRRSRLVGRKRRIIPVERRTIRADIFRIVTHVAKYMRMIERRHGPDAHELLRADLDLGDADIIVEMWNDVLGHVAGLLARKRAPYPVGTAISTRRCEKAANGE